MIRSGQIYWAERGPGELGRDFWETNMEIVKTKLSLAQTEKRLRLSLECLKELKADNYGADETSENARTLQLAIYCVEEMLEPFGG